ncbi:MAG: YqgE/AlgH family protein [Acidobacteriota bacterium]|nr:YqgE/AlgH family protein [Acidobacteriota bacterium]
MIGAGNKFTDQIWIIAGIVIVYVLGLNASPVVEKKGWLDAGLNFSQKLVTPQKGMFLVASPNITDPRFYHSVILLLAHEEDGTIGLIINRTSQIPLSKVLPKLEGAATESQLLFLGGPVGLNELLFLIRSSTPLEQSQQVMEEVHFSGDQALLEGLLKQDYNLHNLRVYVGRSGWAPGQLSGEIGRGDWELVNGDPYTVFDKDVDDIWYDLTGYHKEPRFIVQHFPYRATIVGVSTRLIRASYN